METSAIDYFFILLELSPECCQSLFRAAGQETRDI